MLLEDDEEEDAYLNVCNEDDCWWFRKKMLTKNKRPAKIIGKQLDNFIYIKWWEDG